MGITGTTAAARFVPSGWAGPAVTVSATIAAWLVTVVLLLDSPAPRDDQALLLDSSWTGPWWPSPQHGPLSQAIAATLRLFVPTAGLQLAYQTFASAVLLSLVAWLAFRVTRRHELAALAVALVGTSPAATSWITSDVLEAAALVGVGLAVTTRRGWLVGVAGAALVLTKPDAALAAAAVIGFVVWRWRDPWPAILTVGVPAVLMVPGTLLVDGYWQYSAGTPDRTWVAFGQHFAYAIGVERLPGGPDPWHQFGWYTRRLLPGPKNIGAAIVGHPGMYLEFLRYSIRTLGFHTAELFGPLVLLAGGLPWTWKRSNDTGRALVLSLVGVAPAVLLVWPSVRHLAHWYPAAVVGAVWMASKADRVVWKVAILLTAVLSLALNVHGVVGQLPIR